MDWVSRMNAAMDYIEDHITEEIAYSEIAKVACCSSYHFQRMFSFMTDVSLSEYIRRRRLSLAAFELQGSSVKVVDLALKYGYDSPEAFARAFQHLHGTTPTAARSAGTKLKAFPRMSFQISIKGAAEMNYRMEQTPGFAIVGIKQSVIMGEAFSMVPKIWVSAMEKGVFEELWNIRDPGHKMRGILGVCANGEFGKNEEFDYIIAIASGQAPPEGMVAMEFPEATWAVFEASGSPDSIQDVWKRLYTEWVPASAYDLAYLPAIECYLPIEENKNELWVPVVKKQ